MIRLTRRELLAGCAALAVARLPSDNITDSEALILLALEEATLPWELVGLGRTPRLAAAFERAAARLA